jgi:hypothetical protein
VRSLRAPRCGWTTGLRAGSSGACRAPIGFPG